jgi:hypothetical protein
MNGPERQSVWAFGAALISLAALAMTARGLPFLAVLAAAILLSYFAETRLRDRTGLRWFVRLLLIAIIWVVTPDDPNAPYDQVGPTRSRNIFGEICAAEMAFQFWRSRRYDPERSNLAIMVMSGLTFLTASNTFEETFIRLFAPLYVLCIGLMGRSYRPRGGAIRRQWFGLPFALRGVALALVVGVGMIGYRETVANRTNLTDFSNRFLFKLPWNMETTGMSSQPMLGPIFGMRGSPARVLRIVGNLSDNHLVGAVYDTYSRSRWGPALVETHWKTAADTALHIIRPGLHPGGLAEAEITRLSDDSSLLYLPLETAQIDVTEAEAVSQPADGGGPFRVKTRGALTYGISAATVPDYQGVAARPLDAAMRTRCLYIPTVGRGMDGVIALGRRITSAKIPPRARVSAIVEYLQCHPYSLEYHPTSGEVDPLADFLLSRPPKGAHCEFFAASAAILLRSVGVPTVYVTGYYAHESESANVTVVRGRDAHAWCQAWIDGVGWITVDATPADGRPDALADLTPVEWWRRTEEWLQDRLLALLDFVSGITQLQVGIAVGAVCVAIGAILTGRSRALRRRRLGEAGTKAGYTTPDAELTALSERFEAAFRRRGGAFPANRTYSEHLREGPGETVERIVVERAAAFAELYELVRFGGHNEESERAQLERHVRDLEMSKD